MTKNASASRPTDSLADFISDNLEPILEDWEHFARNLEAGRALSSEALRDHAKGIVTAVVADMREVQSFESQAFKGKGQMPGNAPDLREAAETHALTRLNDKFSIDDLFAEFRAIRASVLRRWAVAKPDHVGNIIEVTRFNEAIDQATGQSLHLYSAKVVEARETIIGVLAHDLRTPLQAIALSTQALLADQPVGSPQERKTKRVLRSAAKMSTLIGDLLDYTSTRLGHSLPINRIEGDLSLICAEAIAELQSAHPECSINYQAIGDTRGAWDESRIGQLVANLVNNALFHGASHKVVAVNVSGMPDGVTVKIHNDGPAISAELKARLFEPFKVKDEFTGRQALGSSGLGLGLFITAQITDAHGGRIEVDSTIESGTTFNIFLPRN